MQNLRNTTIDLKQREFHHANDTIESAQTPAPQAAHSRYDKVIKWVFRVTNTELPLEHMAEPAVKVSHIAGQRLTAAHGDNDWNMVSSLCGHEQDDFEAAETLLPLTSAEIGHFRRFHRDADSMLGSRFQVAGEELPEPMASFYSLYLTQARLDTEATLFLAQASGSTRVARVMGDLVAIGGFANGHKSLAYRGAAYAVSSAFDTSDFIDLANAEAATRLALPIDHASHLLKFTPDDIALLASGLVERARLSPADFLNKARLLAEARQDVNRFEVHHRFRTAVAERDLPAEESWVQRIHQAYTRMFPAWVANMPEFDRAMRHKAGHLRLA